MDSLENIAEYYDELFPVAKEQKFFFDLLLKKYSMPAKILRVGCGTGTFEHYLARLGHDVTGLETSAALLKTAVLRRRMPNTAIRFFLMRPVEMMHFLGRGFYNIITCLDGDLYFISDKTLLRKFFYDCRSLLTKTGCLILHLPDIGAVRESLRIQLVSVIEEKPEDGTKKLSQELVRGGGKNIPVRCRTPIYTPTFCEIKEYAAEAGFTDIQCFSGYLREEYTVQSRTMLFVLAN